MVAILDDPLAAALRQLVAEQGQVPDAPDGAWAVQGGNVGEREAGATAAAKMGAGRRSMSGVAEARPQDAPALAGKLQGSGAVERRALESATLALLVRHLAPVVHRLPVETLASALSAADTTTAAASLAATLSAELSARAAATPLVHAWLESARRKRELLEEAGGGLTTAQVAEVRGITRQAVERARHERRLLAVPSVAGTGGGDWLFPAAQFGPDGHPLPGLAAVLRAFQATQVVDPWTQLSELLAPDPELGDRSILGLLREEGEGGIPAALAALREVGAMGA